MVARWSMMSLRVSWKIHLSFWSCINKSINMNLTAKWPRYFNKKLNLNNIIKLKIQTMDKNSKAKEWTQNLDQTHIEQEWNCLDMTINNTNILNTTKRDKTDNNNNKNIIIITLIIMKVTINRLHIWYISKSEHYYLVHYIYKIKKIETSISRTYRFSTIYHSRIPDVSEMY